MAVLSALVAISCGKEPIKGGGDIHTDNSFEVDSEVLYNQDYMSESVRFSLKEGHEGEFSCSVSIDGKNVSSIIRIGSSASEFTSGDKVSLSSAQDVTFVFPTISEGKHKALFSFMRESVRKEIEVSYTERVPIIVTSAYTGEENVVFLESAGDLKSARIRMHLDGEAVSSMTVDGTVMSPPVAVDFTKTPSVVLGFVDKPSTGDHLVKITAETDKASCSATANFYESIDNEISLETYHEPAYLSDMLKISLKKGEPTVYNIKYTIDGSEEYKLLKSDGSALPTTFAASLDPNVPITCRFPRLSEGTHVIDFVFQAENESGEEKYRLKFNGYPSIGAEVSELHLLAPKLTLTTGQNYSGTYRISFNLDGSEYNGMLYNGTSVNSQTLLEFGPNQKKVFTFSKLEADGSHILKVTVLHGVTGEELESVQVNFSVEPMELVLKLNNDNSRDVYFTYSSPNNFSGQAITMRMEITAHAECPFIHETSLATTGAEIYITSANDTKISESVRITPGTKPVRLSIDKIDQMLDGLHTNLNASHQWRHPTKKRTVRLYGYIMSMGIKFIFGDDDSDVSFPVNVRIESCIYKENFHYPFQHMYPTWYTIPGPDAVYRKVDNIPNVSPTSNHIQEILPSVTLMVQGSESISDYPEGYPNNQETMLFL